MNFIVDKTMPDEMLKTLSKYGNIFKSKETVVADKSVSTHPDIQIHFVSNDTAFCAPSVYSHYINILPEYINLRAGNYDIGRTYPSCCAYNIARVGKYVICNTKYADSSIMEYYDRHHYNIVNVNQGYTKCNICPISENSFITEDVGIFNSVSSIKDLNAILIQCGSVRLGGFDYGFIGGASGSYNGKVLFCGKIPSNKELYNILMQNNIEFMELSECQLTDFGSVISFC